MLVAQAIAESNGWSSHIAGGGPMAADDAVHDTHHRSALKTFTAEQPRGHSVVALVPRARVH